MQDRVHKHKRISILRKPGKLTFFQFKLKLCGNLRAGQTTFDPVDVVQARLQGSEVQPNLVGIWMAFTILRFISIVSHQCIDY